jgi:hypothetical protein
MRRRSFLKLTGGATVLAAASFSAFALTRTPQKAVQPWNDAGSAHYDDPRLAALSFAILAPNPHNRQPWIADINEPDTIALHFDTDRQLPHTDPYDRQLTIGMGCFLELLEMAANAGGYQTDITLFPEGTSPGGLDERPVAIIHFRPDPGVSADPLFAHVLDRRSYKEAHDMSKTLAPDRLAAIIGAAANDTTVGGTVEPATLQDWRDLTTQALAIEIDTPHTFKESVDLFRIGKSEINANPDGIELPGLSMELMALTGMMSREAALDPDSIAFREGRKATLAPLASSMGFVWMTTVENNREAQIAAGRDWVRLNLAATREGVGFHPNSQALQEYDEMKPLFDRVHETLAPDGGTVQMLARIGYGKTVGPTPRWPLETRLINA